MKAHKLHLASDRTSCSKATANQFRLVLHTAAYWLLHTLRGLAPKRSFWRAAQFDTLRLALIKVAARVTELATRIKLALPSELPYRDSLMLLAPGPRGRPEPRGGVPRPSPSPATTSPDHRASGATARHARGHPGSATSLTLGRVEDGRGGLGQVGIAPFPVPAHQTGRAGFPHPAFRLASSRGTRSGANVDMA